MDLIGANAWYQTILLAKVLSALRTCSHASNLGAVLISLSLLQP
jgi:hypothetical protein